MALKEWIGKNTSEWIGGLKTFLKFPYGPQTRPTDDYQLTNKHWTVESDSCDKLVVSVSAHVSPTANDIWIDTNRNPMIIAPVSSVGQVAYEDVFCYLCDATSGDLTVTLANASNLSNREFVFKKTDTTANAVIIQRLGGNFGTETFDGNDRASLRLTNQGDTLHLISDGVNWHIITMDAHMIKPTSITVTVGTSAEGVADLQTAYDGNVYNLSEAQPATPGMNLEVEFTNILRINEVAVRGYYKGTAAHYVEIQLYNYATTAWDSLTHMVDEDVFSGHLKAPPNSDDYVSSGNAIVRFYHPSAGISSHDLYLDMVNIRGLS